MKLHVQNRGEQLDFGNLPEGDAGIRATLAAMIAAADDAAKDERVKHVARLLAAEPASYRGSPRFLDRVYTWLRDFRHYQPDPKGVELIRDPIASMEAMQLGKNPGIDCDDLAVLAASIILASGRYEPVYIVVSRTPKEEGGRFHHVFYGVMRDRFKPASKDNTVPFDPQEGISAGEWSAKVERVGVVKVRQ